MNWHFVLAVVFAGTAITGVAQEAACNPRPQPDDLVLPMPNGLKMVFRPVYLGIGDGPLAVREFIMGSAAGDGFRETPTKVQLGGSLLGDNAGKRDWLFFLGKYEVTREQFSAVVPPGSDSAEAQGGRARAGLPKTNLTRLEVENFLERYNLWLFANARDVLPKLDGVPGFARLPTEAEWEFGARGGCAVDTARFDQRVPYSGDLAHYEWFGGPRSSHDKLQAIGLLDPNPLGLYDMLGNAAEMVSQLYQIEYIQGRAGGLVVRGGDFRSGESELRSSRRTEQPLYTGDLRPARADNIGFRVALASPVFTSLSITRQIEAAWPAYAQTRIAPMPARMTIAPVTEQTNVALRDVDGLLTQLETVLGQGGRIPEAAQAKINLIRSAFSDINANILSGEEKAAEGGVRLASIASKVMASSLRMLPIDEALLRLARYPAEIQADRRTLDECKASIEDSRRSFDLACQQLGRISFDLVERKFDAWIAELKHRGILEQARTTEVAKRNYAEFFKAKRSVVDQWAQDLDPSKLGVAPGL